MVQYQALLVQENLYWDPHVDNVCISLVKFVGIFNHVKHFGSKRIAHHLYISFNCSRIKYGIEVCGYCADTHLPKAQVMPIKLLKFLFQLDYRTSTNLLHYKYGITEIADIHTVNISFFSNECRAGRNNDIFNNYYTVREATSDFRHEFRLFVPLTRTELDSNCCAILGAILRNKYFNEINPQLFKKLFRKRVTKYFIANHIL